MSRTRVVVAGNAVKVLECIVIVEIAAEIVGLPAFCCPIKSFSQLLSKCPEAKIFL